MELFFFIIEVEYFMIDRYISNGFTLNYIQNKLDRSGDCYILDSNVIKANIL